MCVYHIVLLPHFLYHIQEGPEEISVCGRSMRTTSSLEANNCRLNDSVINHGNFFSFARDLRKEEFMKSKEFERHLISGGKQEEKKDKHMVRIFIALQSFVYHLFTNTN